MLSSLLKFFFFGNSQSDPASEFPCINTQPCTDPDHVRDLLPHDIYVVRYDGRRWWPTHDRNAAEVELAELRGERPPRMHRQTTP